MAGPSGAGIVTTQKLGRMARWWIAAKDVPEVALLYGWIGVAFGLGCYSVKRVMLNNTAGAYWNVNMRGDMEKQVETGRVGLEDPASGKHSIWYRLAQIKVDKDGANIGVLFDNRTRPHQYSKPGEAGIGAGVNMGAI